MNKSNALRSDKLRYTPIPKLLFGMSAPAMLSMLVHALYNIVDSIFVSHYNTKALDAIAIAFPLQILIIAFATGIGVGANAVVAKNLGEKKYGDASNAAQTGMLLTFISAFIFVLIGVFASKPFVSAFTDDPETILYGGQYLFIVLTFSGFAFTEILMSKVLQATGNMKVPMIAQLSGAVVNTVFDPLLIFGIGFFPELGIRGAAIATVMGQAVSMLIVIGVFLFTKQDVKPFFKKDYKMNKNITAQILRIGVPTIIMKGMNSITVTFINMILKSYQYAITVLGIYIKLQSFVFMPVFGLTQGALPIMSYNYGAKNKKRFAGAFKLSLITAAIIMLTGFLIFELLPKQLMALFNAEGGLMAMGIRALRIFSVSFVFAAFGIMMTTMFQSLGMGITALIMSLMRQLILIMPLAALLSFLMGADGVWWSYVIAELVTVAIFLPIAVNIIRKKFPSPVQEQAA